MSCEAVRAMRVCRSRVKAGQALKMPVPKLLAQFVGAQLN
jgi:hypothetical protein